MSIKTGTSPRIAPRWIKLYNLTSIQLILNQNTEYFTSSLLPTTIYL